MSKRPSIRAVTNSSAFAFDASGTSRSAGATIGRPPRPAISLAVSARAAAFERQHGQSVEIGAGHFVAGHGRIIMECAA
jgi:hypothetical protein